jgi:very-short-patch-repair endonuclease
MSVVLRGHKWRDTKPEVDIRKALEELNIKFEAHKHIGKYEIDFYLINFKICLEVLGVYWHTLPEVSARDKIKFEYLRSQGYRTLYYWEDDIFNKKIDLKALLIDEILQVGVGHPTEADSGTH